MANPDRPLIDDLVRQMDQSFGHLDFWWLSKKWKKIVYQQMAARLIWIIREYDNHGTPGSRDQQE